MVTLQVDVPLQAPVQPAKVELGAGAAVSVTAVPAANPAAQAVPQLIPDGALEILPVPVPDGVTVS